MANFVKMLCQIKTISIQELVFDRSVFMADRHTFMCVYAIMVRYRLRQMNRYLGTKGRGQNFR